MEQWTLTKDVREAAAFGTIGMPIKLRKTMVARTNRVEVVFHIGLMNQEGTERTKKIQADYRAGKLRPTHPFLTILRTFSNRNAILDLQQKGRRIALRPTNAPGIWRYEDGDSGLPGVPRGEDLITTGDLKMASALATVGHELLRIEGPHGARKYSLKRWSQPLEGVAPADGIARVKAWRADRESVPWEDPFAQACRGLHNRERVLDAAKRELALVLLQKPRSARNVSALVREDASDAAFEEAAEFFEQQS